MSQTTTQPASGATATGTVILAPPSLGRRLRGAATSSPAYMLVILVVLVTFFSFMRPHTFASTFNLRNIFMDASVLMVVAIGMTFVMIAGGFDLSVGSVLVFAGVAAAKAMEALGTDTVGTVVIGTGVALVAGMTWGAFNGFCIARLKVSALITTLGSMGSALGMAYLITSGNDVRTVPTPLIALGSSALHGVPWLVVIAALFTVVGMVALHLTRYGRHTYLLGSNTEASRRAGINVPGHLLSLYMLSGLLAGVAAMLSLGRFSTTTLEGHMNDPLDAITAVVLGGTSLYGGRGTIIGTVIGVFIPAVLANGFVIMGVQPFWQMVAVGFVVIAAVYADQLKRQSQDRG
ncbi:MAG: ABC transporter permease [Rhodospirillales bacterium]|nr:ABC transporter permease [Rhodospirillales bacterium]MDE2576807.1 ABC transporter permease [Rhodospirillales bacterium]